MIRFHLFITCCLLAFAGCKETTPAGDAAASGDRRVPTWAAEAVFYQIFPERFRNGDPSNDPTRETLERPIDRVPESWTLMPWTGDWYARADWEQAMGDSFYDDGVFDRRYGGDLRGVLDELDYLEDLGINALYFNPVFYARSLHKYDGNTYHHVDPYFGPDPAGDLAMMEQETSDPSTWRWTAADSLFLALVRQAHLRGIRLIIDGVFNHTGRDFFAFADLRKNQEASPYKDWYIVKSFDDPDTPEDEFDYKGWWDVKTLPEFADNAAGDDLQPGPRQYIFDATRRWMDPDGDGDPSDGIDGWRLDVANEVPIGFWEDWNALVRDVNPEAYTVTEIWDDAATFLRQGGFSATMNYYGFAFPVKGFLIDDAIGPARFADLLTERRQEYSDPVRFALQNLIDSHDTDRLASMIVNAGHAAYTSPERFDYDWGGHVSPRSDDTYDVGKPDAQDREVQRLVALFQMTYVGAPMVYYGTEAGMWDGDDPDDRMPMVWPDLEYAPQTHDPLGRPRRPDTVAFDYGLHDFYRAVIHLRTEHPALSHGTFDVLATDDDHAVFAFARTTDEQRLVVVLNRSDDTQRLRLETPGRYDVVFSTKGQGYSAQPDGEAVSLEIPALTGLVLQRE